MPLSRQRQPVFDAGRLAWRIVSVQMAVAGVGAFAVSVVGGLEAAAGFLFGTLVVALPQWCAHQVLRAGTLGLPRLLALEGLRVGSSVVLLLYGARSLPGFTWWAALIGLVLAVKAPWFVMLREDRNS